MNLETFYKLFLLFSVFYILISFFWILYKERKKGKNLFLNFKKNFLHEIKGITEKPMRSLILFILFLVLFYFIFFGLDNLFGKLFVCNYSVNIQEANYFYLTYSNFEQLKIKKLNYYLEIENGKDYNYYRKKVNPVPPFVKLECKLKKINLPFLS